MYRTFLLLTLLAGCGAETVGTAAIVATQKKQEIEQGQQLKDQVQQQLEAAQKLEQQRLDNLEQK